MNQSAGAAQHTHRYSVEEKDIGPVGPDRNWKGIGISLLVILVVLSFIGLSIVLLSKDTGSKTSGSPLTLDDLFQRSFQIHDPDAKWISAKEIIFQRWDGNVFKMDMNNNKTELLLKNTTFATFKASKFAISPDLNFVLLGYDVKQVHRHSFLASYLIYNLYTREVQELNPPEVSNSALQFASWGVQGQQLIYIFENNIYYKANVQSSSWRLTSSGQDGVVFNGITDWLYEMEVLHHQAAHWWSPDGSRLAYLTINDSLVPTMFLPRFTGSLYPRGTEYRYPKMGQNNPAVGLHVITLDGSSFTEEIKPPDGFHTRELYITMVKWVAQEKLSVRWVNRAQNMSVLSLCDTTAGSCITKHVMVSDKWLDGQNEKPVFSRDSTAFFTIMPLKHSSHGAFNHIAMISNHSSGKDVSLHHLTSGTWDVTHILSYDESTNSVFFLSTEEGPSQQHLYRVSVMDSSDKECLSCSLFRSNCTYYDAALSSDCQHVLLNCRGPGLPQTTLHKLSSMREFQTLDESAELRAALKNRRVPKTERRTVQINSFAFRLELILPMDLDETQKHPLLLVLWESVLVSSEHIIVARVDGRGSSFQGEEILYGVHQRLGTVDAQDQTTALEQLLKLPYIDESKVGVYGKAYGGFLSTVLLLSHNSRFRCGIAVAPITDWRLYGSACSEKYFGFPAKEEYKYQISSLVGITATQPQELFIIHGTEDATVHFQHSAELVKLLSSLNVNYTLQIFPDEGHTLSSHSQQFMLSSVMAFYKRCFQEKNTVALETSKEDD
ncbi:inactive dipeptidyl peptidase 10 isoform X2 [Oryzias melastigma]|uniref:inactive dipeptidyl peptidase 10 isoform X2 n=1 Tax=Oryzias melastigma TaxID=30732 RepID=UPI000CF80BA5|nr:inactive dipeptidyl peptidase 10 isoform X2 [Oryzias melastigma]